MWWMPIPSCWLGLASLSSSDTTEIIKCGRLRTTGSQWGAFPLLAPLSPKFSIDGKKVPKCQIQACKNISILVAQTSIEEGRSCMESSPCFSFLWLNWAGQRAHLSSDICLQLFVGKGQQLCCFNVSWESGVISPTCVTKSCSELLTCEHQPLISSGSKVTRAPRPPAWCHNTP